MDRFERLAIEAECTHLIVQFVWCIDMSLPEEAAGLFTPDGVYEHVSGMSWKGFEGICALLADRGAQAQKAVHLVSNILVDVVDRENARARMLTRAYVHQGAFDPSSSSPLAPFTIFPSDVRFTLTEAGWRACRWRSLNDFRAG